MKKRISYYVAALVGKAMIHGMHLMKRNATNLPGEVALQLCPSLLANFQMPKHVIVVTGTNGKTTVTNLIGNVLKKCGNDIITNAFGGNVDTGIASLLLANSKLNGTLTADTLLLEMDERSAQRILPYVKPDYLVCTNLQRDSMKRNAHVEFIFDFLNRNIPEKTVVISNADDLVSSQLVPENKHIYFGVALLDGEVPTNDSLVSDIVNCPNCGTRLQFSFRHYNHIGQATCPNCGFCNAKADFQVKKVENCTATIQHHDTTEIYPIPNDRITDIYNSAAVITFLRTYGISQQQVADCLKGSEIVKSRYDTLTSHGKPVYITLAKGQNSIACSAACDFVRKELGKKAVILILEDFYDRRRTSENIAWIYETDFEFLKQDDVVQIIVGGKRATDYLVRLLIAGIDRSRIVCCASETETVQHLQWDKFDKLMILYDLYNTESLSQIKKQLQEDAAI